MSNTNYSSKEGMNRNNKLAEDKLTTYFGDSVAVIQEGGKRYDVILATQRSGGANVLNDLKKVVDSVNTETINSAFSVTVGAKQDLDSFM
jgi:hypothetical protein